jgi:outer membrane lipoprotein SlyB
MQAEEKYRQWWGKVFRILRQFVAGQSKAQWPGHSCWNSCEHQPVQANVYLHFFTLYGAASVGKIPAIELASKKKQTSCLRGSLRESMKYVAVILALLALTTACTSTDEIIIDKQGVDMSRYNQDLAECRSYGTEVQTEKKAVKGAASGAVVGGLIGAITGDAGKAAGVGAVGGGAKGASQGEQEEVQVVKRCLRGRGYKVLN